MLSGVFVGETGQLDGEEEREKLSRELQEYGLAIQGEAEDQTEERYGLVISDAGISDSSSEVISVVSQTPTPPSNPQAVPVPVDTVSGRSMTTTRCAGKSSTVVK